MGLAVRLSYGTIDELVERFAVNISRGGVFIRTRDPRPVGTRLLLELRLSGGEAAIRGEGVVRWIQAEDPAAHPRRAPGMGIQFTKLDDASRALVERMAELKERRGVAPGVVAPAPIAARPDGWPAPTRAPAPVMPAPAVAPSGATPAPSEAAHRPSGLPARSTLATPYQRRSEVEGPAPRRRICLAPHRVEPVSAGPVRVELGLPASPHRVARPSRAIIGIDLGTTNSCAAVVRDGRPYVIPSREGHATVPSIVALNARNRIVVGHLAKAQLLTNPKATVSGAKRLIGRAYDAPVVQEMRAKFPYEIVPDDGGVAAVRLGSETVSLEQISALILREVSDVAQNHLREEVNRAVITVPAYYNERQRAAVRQAAGLAGIEVERILNEPTAAALAYAYGRHLNQRVLVYDLGGGTFDASVLELSDNVYEVVSTGGDTFLGGVDFDNRIVDRLLASWAGADGRAVPGRPRRALAPRGRGRAREVRALRAGGVPGEPALPRPDATARPSRSRRCSRATRSSGSSRRSSIGRSTCVARCCSRRGSATEGHRRGAARRRPVAHAARTRQGGRVLRPGARRTRSIPTRPSRSARRSSRTRSGSAEGVVLIDVLPMSIGIGLPGGRVKTIIERNTPLPTRKQYGLATTRDGQTEFELAVFQGESRVAAECEYLGTLRLAGLPPGPRGMVKIAVAFELGAECLLTVTARELNTGREVQAVMSAREGAEAARRKLEQGGGADAARAQTGDFPAPDPAARLAGAAVAGGAGDVAETAGGADATGAIAGFFRKIFGRRSEAR